MIIMYLRVIDGSSAMRNRYGEMSTFAKSNHRLVKSLPPNLAYLVQSISNAKYLMYNDYSQSCKKIHLNRYLITNNYKKYIY